MPRYEGQCSNTDIYNEEFAPHLSCPHEINQCGIQYHDVKESDSFYLETKTYLKNNSMCNYELYFVANFTGIMNILVEEANDVTVRVFKQSERYELLDTLSQNQSTTFCKSQYNVGVRYYVQVMSDGNLPHAKVRLDVKQRFNSDASEASDMLESATDAGNL